MQPNEAGIVSEPDESQKLAEYQRAEHDRYLRLMADFDNYRRRVQNERDSAAQSWKRRHLLFLIEILDDFERALQHASGMPSSVLEGLRAIERKVEARLAADGVTRFNSLGEPFNPELHEALGTVDTDRCAPGIVAEEEQPGYRWGGDVLRPARVRISR